MHIPRNDLRPQRGGPADIGATIIGRVMRVMMRRPREAAGAARGGRQSYLIALGSNRSGKHGSPRAEIHAALTAIGAIEVSPIMATPPLGPSDRAFANAVARIEADADPPALLARLKAIERDFGRRRGRRWASRVIDLDIIAWSGGIWHSPGLNVPHRALRGRAFVLAPLVALAPGWRDPVTGLNTRQLYARLRPQRRSSAGKAPTSVRYPAGRASGS